MTKRKITTSDLDQIINAVEGVITAQEQAATLIARLHEEIETALGFEPEVLGKIEQLGAVMKRFYAQQARLSTLGTVLSTPSKHVC